MPFLALNNISKAYAGVPALRSATLSIEPAEIHALMGENGAGKSTLIKILAGVVAPDTAGIEIEGRPTTIDSPATAHRLGLRFIHQEMNVVPALSVAENIFIGRRYPKRFGILVDWAKLEATARQALETLGITHIDPRTRMARLSMGDQMLVRISSAFLSEPGAPARLYVMDEPTAALTAEESERLFRVLRQIRADGGSVLYVSHRLDEVMALCDRATVLRDGKSIDSGSLSEITHDDLVAMMIGRKVEEAYPKPAAAPSSEVAFEVENLRAEGLKPLSLSVRKGEILGIAGLAGAGQRELLRALFGDLPMSASAIRLGGETYRPGGPRRAWQKGIAYVPRERRSEGLVLTRPIYENVTLAHLTDRSIAGTLLNPRHERQFAAALGESVKLKARSPDQRALELSGGNQQKVVFAKALSGNPKLLLLDEPTRGVDVGAKFDIYTIIRDMTAKGMAVVLVSSDLPELIGMCDRIAILRDGAITETVDAHGLTEEDLINRCYGRATGVAA
ncbi:MAG TPA: sugar ABC transporter ATP-binding protein [Devosia sp.]|nr:sugar ABC transporter ATP-binding protein [Devosia sp.]